jgi:competence protein ComEA
MTFPRSALLLTLALLASVPAAPASGQEPEDSPQRLGFSIQAVDSPKGHFDLKADPGSTVRGTLVVSNPGTSPIEVILRRQDTSTAQAGGLQYDKPRAGGTGEWLKLDARSVRLAAGASRRVALEIRVPDGVRGGDHFAGIVAYNAADLARAARQRKTGAVNVSFVSRFAVAVRVRIPGPAKTRLELGGLRIESTPSGAAIVVDLDNTGDRLIPTSSGQITVTQDGKELLSRPISLTAFIPRTRIAYPLPWQGAPSEGTYRVRGFVHPANGQAITIDSEIVFGSKESESFNRQTGLEAVGDGRGANRALWVLIAVLVLAVAALAISRLRSGAPPAAMAAAAPAPAPTGAPSVVVSPPVAAEPRPDPAAAPVAAEWQPAADAAAPQPEAVAPHVATAPQPEPHAAPGAAGPQPEPQPALAAASAPPTNGAVDLNSASADELLQLPGIGRAAANRIVAHRDEYGAFESVASLLEVEGFDSARVQRLSSRAVAR